jgi:hypothetical protein
MRSIKMRTTKVVSCVFLSLPCAESGSDGIH